MSILTSLLTQLLHLALMLALAPVLTGFVRWLKARLMGRRGPHPLQPWRDFLKLLKKRPVLAENASIISRAAPYVAVASALPAAALVPSFAPRMVLAPFADLLLIAGLLALGRFAMALAGMDVGTAFGGIGATREMAFAALSEPALVESRCDYWDFPGRHARAACLARLCRACAAGGGRCGKRAHPGG